MDSKGQINILIGREISFDYIDVEYSFVLNIYDCCKSDDIIDKFKMFGNIVDIDYRHIKNSYSNLELLDLFKDANNSSNYIFAFDIMYKEFSYSTLEIILKSLMGGYNYNIDKYN